MSKPEQDPLDRYLSLIKELHSHYKYNLIDALFPDDPTHPFSRWKYKKHMEFFAAGIMHDERLFCAANRVGKTLSGGYEVAIQATGKYPDWWQGRTWNRGIDILVAGTTKETTRDIIQAKLMGKSESEFGTGLIPAENIHDYRIKGGTGGSLDWVTLHHASGGISTLWFKSYDQRRKAFEGTERDLVWEDEEAPQDIHEENAIRLMTRDGAMMNTFTPLAGLTELVLSFMPGGKLPKQERKFACDVLDKRDRAA